MSLKKDELGEKYSAVQFSAALLRMARQKMRSFAISSKPKKLNFQQQSLVSKTKRYHEP